VKPATVLTWHRRGFKSLWRRKSRSPRPGRPRIAQEHIGFIQRVSSDHPEWGEDKIAEELAAKFLCANIHETPSLAEFRVG